MAPTPASEKGKVDCLVVGSGPAGLMMANWLSRLGVKTRIIDKRGTKIFNGQADGLQSRTLEIMDSFGFAHRVWRESNHMLEINLWNPDPQGNLFRSDKIPDTIPNISRFQQVVLHQGRIERFFLDSIAEYSDIRVERGVLPETMDFDESKAEDNDAYPIKVQLRHLSEEEATPKQSATSANGAAMQDGLFRSNLSGDDSEDLLNMSRLNDKAGSTETLEAKYVVGCDGAHSWVRSWCGFSLRGEQTDYVWGVLDIIPITDFPDIRMRCAIHSASSGSLMIIPRENKLVRLYIQLTTTEKIGSEGTRIDRSKINPDVILGSAQRILHPYKLTYRYCDWWTGYQIGQRVGDDFSLRERIFLAGDAVHTHSPKAGQGMNVSMQDTYNLGWKIGAVINGTCDRTILKTYQSERRRIAQNLIDFDHRFSRMFSGRPAKDVMDEEGISMAEFKDAFEKGNMFASGLAVDYGKSMIVAKEGSAEDQGDGTEVMGSSGADQGAHSNQSLATGIKLGMRMPSFKVLNQSDARPWHLQELLKSNGRWRVIVFAGNILNPNQMRRIEHLGAQFNSLESFIRRYTPDSQPIDGVIEVLAIHSSSRKSVDVFALPAIFRPFSPTEGWDYAKICVDDESYHEGHGEAYKNYGIDHEKGCAVIVRPDQYVSWVGEVDDYAMMDRFFAGCLQKQKKPHIGSIDAPERMFGGKDTSQKVDSTAADIEVMEGTVDGGPNAAL
ncbi:hypothetical protein LTR08_008304 [Meristemomyces frigidus]|nr:hypothetical protein LTR08_008304 [Meristemomyces frigidus]